MKKTRILHIIKSLGRGGAEKLLPETLKFHNRDKFEFHYIYFLPWKDQMVSALIQEGGRVICMNAGNNVSMMARLLKVERYVKEQSIDLIHAHLPWSGVLARLLGKRTGLPVIYTEHNKQERYHYVTRFLNRLTFRWQSAVVAVSGDVAASIARYINASVPVLTIANGVDGHHFQRDSEARYKLQKDLGLTDKLVVGTVAVFRPQKRLKEWLDIFAKAAARSHSLRAIIVGDGPLKNEIVSHARALHVEDKIIMAGLQADVRPWMSLMDIFMICSEFEGLPVTLLEAMSMRCAVVSTAAGGIGEVLEHGSNGLIVPVDEWRNLESELLRLVENRPFLNLLGDAARATVVERFGIEQMVLKLEKLYDNLSQDGTPGTPFQPEPGRIV